MNHKQKLGYTVLGAGIMLVGITIGQFVTPNIEAQRNNVFDKIICRELEVVDAKGNKAIVLTSEEFRGEGFDGEEYEIWENKMVFYKRQGKQAVKLVVDKWSSEVLLNDREGNRGVWLHSGRNFAADTNKVVVYEPDKAGANEYEHQGASLQSTGESDVAGTKAFSSLSLNSSDSSMISLKSNDAENSIRIESDEKKNSIYIWNPQGKLGINLASGKNLNYVYLYDQQEEKAAGLFADDDEKYGNRVFAIDKTRKK